MIGNITAPDVFNYADPKSKSWLFAKKIREVFMDYKSPTYIFVIKNWDFHRPWPSVIQLI